MGFKLADISFKHGLCLAPMAGYTDRAMRRICHDFGAEYSVTEMVSAKAVTYGDKKLFRSQRYSTTRDRVLCKFSAQSRALWHRRQEY